MLLACCASTTTATTAAAQAFIHHHHMHAAAPAAPLTQDNPAIMPSDAVIASEDNFAPLSSSAVELRHGHCLGVARPSSTEQATAARLYLSSDLHTAIMVGAEALNSFENTSKLHGASLDVEQYVHDGPGARSTTVLLAAHPVFGVVYKHQVHYIDSGPATRTLCYLRPWNPAPSVHAASPASFVSHLAQPSMLGNFANVMATANAGRALAASAPAAGHTKLHVILPFRLMYLDRLPVLLRSLQAANAKQRNAAQGLVRVLVVPMPVNESLAVDELHLLPSRDEVARAQAAVAAANVSGLNVAWIPLPAQPAPSLSQVRAELDAWAKAGEAAWSAAGQAAEKAAGRTSTEREKAEKKALAKRYSSRVEAPVISGLTPETQPASLHTSPLARALLAGLRAVRQPHSVVALLPSAAVHVPHNFARTALSNVLTGYQVYSPVPSEVLPDLFGNDVREVLLEDTGILAGNNSERASLPYLQPDFYSSTPARSLDTSEAEQYMDDVVDDAVIESIPAAADDDSAYAENMRSLPHELTSAVASKLDWATTLLRALPDAASRRAEAGEPAEPELPATDMCAMQQLLYTWHASGYAVARAPLPAYFVLHDERQLAEAAACECDAASPPAHCWYKPPMSAENDPLDFDRVTCAIAELEAQVHGARASEAAEQQDSLSVVSTMRHFAPERGLTIMARLASAQKQAAAKAAGAPVMGETFRVVWDLSNDAQEVDHITEDDDQVRRRRLAAP